ncbi:MAG: type VI secretion system protein ImpK [Colwellia sp.]
MNDDLSKTMVIPNPGGRRTSAQENKPFENQQHNGFQKGQSNEPNALHGELIEGENKLLLFGSDLINLASNLRTLEPRNTVEQLRHDIDNLIKQFDIKLAQQSISQEISLTARYLLCCLIDEHILSTPWGIDSSWSYQTLLSKYHSETSGGEKFFLIVNKLMEQPQRNIDLIELSYVCFALGFRGKYRLSQTGDNDILQISNMLYQPISLYRPAGVDLSPSWKASEPKVLSIEKRIPPSLLFMILAFICVAVYIALLSNLHAKSSPLYEKVESIGWDNFAVQTVNAAPSIGNLQQMAQDISARLSQYVENNTIAVEVSEDRVILRFISTQLFPSGSARVNLQELPEVNDLVQAILAHSDSVIIVGHTDSTGRADSNWVLSRQRAEAIETWIKTAQTTITQTKTRGVADTQPLVSGKDQSQNRRVELILVPKHRL